MKTIKDKYLVVGADFAGYPLKEAVVAHLKEKGWKITDLGVTAESDPNDTENMFHRVGLRVGAQISEGNFERALLFCGTGMGIHIAASKCPHVHAGVVESVPAALRAITGNGVNVLAMGAFYVAPAMGCDIADAYGLPDSTLVLEAIKRGRILAATVGRKFFISREEAARYIESTAYKADEA